MKLKMRHTIAAYVLASVLGLIAMAIPDNAIGFKIIFFVHIMLLVMSGLMSLIFQLMGYVFDEKPIVW